MKLPDFNTLKSFESLKTDLGISETCDWLPDLSWSALEKDVFKILRSTGIELTDLSELSLEPAKPIQYQGHTVVIYIKDQSYYSNRIKEKKAEYKYHLTECKTIQKMRRENRFERYVATQNKSEKFEIFLNGKPKKQYMRVCKNCLHTLNYKKYKYSNKDKIFEAFNLQNYFDEFSTDFISLPSRTEATRTNVNYSTNFKDLSNQLRKEASFMCQSCDLSLRHHTKFLHVHHIDGDKTNNSKYNLEVLCYYCHANQPSHSHMLNTPDFKAFLTIFGVRPVKIIRRF